MSIVLVLLFALTLLGGGYLLSYVLMDKNTPKGVAIIHGGMGALAIALLLITSFFYHTLFYILLVFIIAALGGTLDVPTLQGKAAVKIPAGTQSGAIFRLRGHGTPHLRRDSRGDLMVHVDIEVPEKLTEEQTAALEKFAIACGDAQNPISDGFLKIAKKFFSGSKDE